MSKVDQKQVEYGYALILEGLGIEWRSSPHMKDTPYRAAKALVNELCAGLLDPTPRLTTFPFKGEPNMVVSKGIPVQSLCAHHLLPFSGFATVSYIPKDKVVGLSKISRIVRFCSRKPQVQEDLTNEVADLLSEALFEHKEGDVAVVIRSRHLCMEYRGVGHSSDVITSSIRGAFVEQAARAEFLSFVDRV